MESKLHFQYPEDRAFFAKLLSNDDETKLDQEYSDNFDFRDPDIKRREFNSLRKELLPVLMKRDKSMCQLHFDDCELNKNLVVDHLIPLSSNKLNRKLRGQVAANGKKPLTQSFGSNQPVNLVIACERCNSMKKHRIINPLTHELI